MLHIIIQIADGIQALHQADNFHGNLKTTNILLFGIDAEIIVKLTDY